MYSFDSVIRYSELDNQGQLNIEALLNYFQDCSIFHSESLGYGVEYLKEHHIMWVLSSWQIEIDRLPALCEKVTVGTFPYDFKGFFGYRNFYLKDEAGEYIAKANTLWTLLDTDALRPVVPPTDMKEAYVLSPKLEMVDAGRKITVPEGGEPKETVTVGLHHLDTNHHVNNVQYVKMAMAFLPSDFQVSRLRVEYKKQALLHDVIKPYVVQTQQENGQSVYVVSLQDENGTVYVNVEFSGIEKV